MVPRRPEGWPAVVPRLFTGNVEELVGFLKTVFDAEGEIHPGRPAEIRIDDSLLMISDGGGMREARPAFLYVYVPDVDAAFARAETLGAKVIEAPADLPYGDRRAMVEDLWGNVWQIATRLT